MDRLLSHYSLIYSQHLKRQTTASHCSFQHRSAVAIPLPVFPFTPTIEWRIVYRAVSSRSWVSSQRLAQTLRMN